MKPHYFVYALLLALGNNFSPLHAETPLEVNGTVTTTINGVEAPFDINIPNATLSGDLTLGSSTGGAEDDGILTLNDKGYLNVEGNVSSLTSASKIIVNTGGRINIQGNQGMSNTRVDLLGGNLWLKTLDMSTVQDNLNWHSGILSITGTLTNASQYESAGVSKTLELSGETASWNPEVSLSLGIYGDSSVTILVNDRATLNYNQETLTVGAVAIAGDNVDMLANASIIVSGQGSSWNMGDALRNMTIGRDKDSSGYVEIRGGGTTWSNASDQTQWVLGENGTSRVNITSGGKWTPKGDIYFAKTETAFSSVLVTGLDDQIGYKSTWETTGALHADLLGETMISVTHGAIWRSLGTLGLGSDAGGNSSIMIDSAFWKSQETVTINATGNVVLADSLGYAHWESSGEVWINGGTVTMGEIGQMSGAQWESDNNVYLGTDAGTEKNSLVQINSGYWKSTENSTVFINTLGGGELVLDGLAVFESQGDVVIGRQGKQQNAVTIKDEGYWRVVGDVTIDPPATADAPQECIYLDGKWASILLTETTKWEDYSAIYGTGLISFESNPGNVRALDLSSLSSQFTGKIELGAYGGLYKLTKNYTAGTAGIHFVLKPENIIAPNKQAQSILDLGGKTLVVNNIVLELNWMERKDWANYFDVFDTSSGFNFENTGTLTLLGENSDIFNTENLAFDKEGNIDLTKIFDKPIDPPVDPTDPVDPPIDPTDPVDPPAPPVTPSQNIAGSEIANTLWSGGKMMSSFVENAQRQHRMQAISGTGTQVWAGGMSSISSVDSSGNAHGYDSTLGGYAVGVTLAPTACSSLGFVVGQGFGNSDVTGASAGESLASIDHESLMLGLLGDYTCPLSEVHTLSFSAYVAYGNMTNKLPATGDIRPEWDNTYTTFGVDAAWQQAFDEKRGAWGFFTGLRYLTGDMDSFRMIRQGVIENYDDGSMDRLIMPVGVNVQYSYEISPQVYLTPLASLAYKFDLSRSDAEVRKTTGKTSSRILGADTGMGVFAVQVGANLNFQKNWNVGVSYEFETTSGENASTFSGTVSYQF